jgi:ribosomal protein S18 acetylase RimI-like enzyme
MQYNARQVSYGRQFPFSDQVLILVHEKRAGALRVLRDTNEIRLIDIALLPEFRGVGIGTRLLGALIDEAATACKPLRLSVARTNVDAIRLDRRLGFKSAGEDGLHLQMELSP